MSRITYGSVCSGIEAATVAFRPLGWRAAWFSEIEPYPCALLAHHYPDVPNLGDMTQIARAIRDGYVSPPDILCGGTPCQAFSIAGLRNSLEDARGNLSLVFCEIADEIDKRRAADGLLPAVIVWENVPGVLSTADNAFGCFLAGLAGEDDPIEPPGGKWPNAGCVYGPKRTVAWRVLDAQYFGVAQRRRRVFVIASAREGFDPAEVLFEFDGVRRDTPPSREAGQEVTRGIECGAESGSRHNSHWNGGAHPPLSQASQTRCGGIGASNQELFEQGGAGLAPVSVIAGGGQLARCLTTKTRIDAETETLIPTFGGVFVGAPISAPVTRSVERPRGDGLDTLIAAQMGMAVRRLTPRECERLQSFPDDYTLIPFGRVIKMEKLERDWIKYLLRGGVMTLDQVCQAAADGPRYKALGNSWCVYNVRWLGRRIDSMLTRGHV